MSIRDEIESLCQGGKLRELASIGIKRGPRRLFVAPLVDAILDHKSWYSPEGNLYVALNGRLEAYMRHDDIPFALNPDNKPPYTAFARAKKVEDGVINVRAWTANKKSHIRLFGCFSETDWFVALLWDFRTGLDVDQKVEDCRKAWDALFPSHKPHSGGSVYDYLSCFVTPV